MQKRTVHFLLGPILCVLMLASAHSENYESHQPPQTQKRQTAHAYSREKVEGNPFCEASNQFGAEALIGGLDQLNEEKSKKIEKAKADLNADIAYMEIAYAAQRAKIELLHSLKHITDNKDSPIAAIEGAKGAFSNALALSSISQLVQGTTSEEAKQSMVCSLFPESKQCDSTLAKFVHYLTGKPNPTFKTVVEASQKSIPRPASPKEILSLIAEKPNLQGVIAKGQTDDLLTCLHPESKQAKKAQEICIKVFGDEEKAGRLMDAVAKESMEVSTHLSPHKEEIDASVEMSKIEFAKHAHIIAQFKKDQDEIAQKNKRIDDDVEKRKSEILNTCRNKVAEAYKHLAFKDKETRFKACDLNPGENYLVGEVRTSIANSIKRIKNYQDEDYYRNEKFKAYLANKYLCHCKKESNVTVVDQPACYNFEGLSATATVYGLGNDVSDILKKYKFSQSIGVNKCSPPAEDLQYMSSECNKNGRDESYKKVCSLVNGENEKIEKRVSQDHEWEKFNDENWIVRDPSAKGGLRRTPKKKTWELVGEGLGPVVPNLVPIWFANYQIKNQIDIYTQQALAEKQYYHTMDTYNQYPWMFNMPYLQGNFIPMNSGSTTPATTNTGFNFSTSP